MAFVRKMQTGGAATALKPPLYSMYGKQYNFNDLQRVADQGLDEYISSLRRGSKDREQFVEAYRNIMNGIKDGTITFEDGRYHDSKGRYTNSSDKNRNKDHYGLIANYIFGMSGKSDEYKAPEDTSKIKWDGGKGLTQYLIKNVFGSNRINLNDFLDVDEIDPETKKRATTNRSRKLYDPLNQAYSNFDNYFTGFSDDEKASALESIKGALDALQNGNVDPGDYLALSRAVQGIDFRKLLSDGIQTQQEQSQQTSGSQNTPYYTDIRKYIQDKYPRYSGTLYSPRSTSSTRRYGTNTLNRLCQAIIDASDDERVNALLNLLVNNNYKFDNDIIVSRAFPNQSFGFENSQGLNLILEYLQANDKLIPIDNNGKLFVIPDTESNNNTVFVWDTDNKQVKEVSIHDVPYYQNKIADEFRSQLPQDGTTQLVGDYSWASQVPAYASLIPSNKKGGVIKALAGTNSNIFFDNDDEDRYNNYLNKIFGNSDVINWMASQYNTADDMERYAQFVQNNVNLRHQNGINDFQNGQRYTGQEGIRTFNAAYQNNGVTPNYTLFGNSSEDYNNRQNGVVYTLGQFSRPTRPLNTGDSYNQDASRAYIDNALGAQTYSRVASLTDKNTDFGAWGDYWRGLGATGAYYYIAPGDTSGRGQWIPTKDPTKPGYKPFAPQETPAPDPNPEPQNPQQEQPDDSKGSHIDPHGGNGKRPGLDMSNLRQLAPELLGLSRLPLSIATNNRIARVTKLSLKPVLLKTYERFHPVYGAYTEMQGLNNDAANLESLAARPMTSDASIQLAGQLDANIKANELRDKGRIADDREIKRTSAEALTRVEDNVARRTDIANKNTMSLNQNARELAQLEASRLKQNWQGYDNYLRGVEERIRAKYDRDLEARDSFLLNAQTQLAKQEYEDAITPLELKIQRWASDPQNSQKALTEMPGYNDYMLAKREALRKYEDAINNIYAQIHNLPYQSRYGNKSYQTLLAQYHFAKGGKLIPRNKLS